ncbi:transmembrane protein, putative (macronuclear) [Tetrahymena thermophila SB210]|uniref:Transmembrane protein, putative n=1 Tax=Tetrahymena thermophila (strain SB210) TaxID=312017 RepID=I7M7Z8_TETTS|nr:transmembrane protein, putative [Tetrahymena thermophila SB210]EAR96336.2 transmembrane protein, putative [Tetrahymena thermophila SB210]|eukprot:XP_001016581.2 transmembrane protein, putative [Tetrahymena thermophila SB210]
MITLNSFNDILIKLIITTFCTAVVDAFDIIDSSCLAFPFCQICSTSSCLICIEGYQLSQDNLCQLNTNIQNKYPKIGFYFDTLSQQLQLCHPSCEMCRGPYQFQCLGCIQGYQEIISYSDMFYCIKCEVSNCSRCDTDGKCLECIPQFYLDQNSNQCTQCQTQNCQICSSVSTCVQCSKGYILSGSGNQCNIESVNAICQIQRCKSCNKEGQCNLCQDGFFLQNGLCKQCQQPCLTCQDESTSCKSCQRDAYKDYYLQGTQCVMSCNHQFYASKQLGRCVECSSAIEGCLTCLDQFTCTSCIDSINYTIQNNKCVRKCKPNQFVLMNSLQQIKSLQQRRLWELDQDSVINSCQNCSPEINSVCKQCIGLPTYCEICQDGYFIYNGKCLNSCPPKTYSLTKSKLKKCFDCMEGCKQCINGNTCLQCEDSFQSNSNQQCQIKYQYALSNQPIKCLQNQVFFNGFCMPSCPSGTIPFKNKCQAYDSCEIISFDIGQQIAVCQKCKDSSKFIYQGYCLSQCPRFLNTASANGICLPKCDSDSLTLLQDYSFPQCVKECPLNSIISGYQELNQQYCIQTSCKLGEYFDTIDYFSSENKDSKQMCKQCHPSCLTCNGPTQYDCIECTTGLVFQEYYLNNDLNPLLMQTRVNYANSTVTTKASIRICQNNCNYGYQKSFNGVCIKCQDLIQCLKCPSFSYINGNKCQDSCQSDPSLIEKIDTKSFSNDFCDQRPGLVLYVSCSKKIGNICLSAKFLTIQAIAQISSFNNNQSSLVCNTSQKFQLIVQFDDNLNLYNITGFNPQIQKFSVSCSLKDQNKQLYGASTKIIEFLGNFTGDFSISTDKANSQYDQINFNLSNFRIPNLLNNQLNFSVQVSTKYIDLSGKEQIFDIFQANQYLNSNFLPQYRNQNLSLSSNFSFPLFNFNQQLQIKAEIFSIVQGERINSFYSKYITVYSNNQNMNNSKIIVQYNKQETVKQIISYILTNYSDTSLNDFSSIYQINDILNYTSNNVSSDIEVQRDVNILKSYNYGFNQQFIGCDSNITCNNQGKCGLNRNYYTMCECFDNYIGEGCSWQNNQLFTNALQYVEQFTTNLLISQMAPYNISMLELKYSILLTLMKSRQIFTQTSFQNIYTILYQLDSDMLNQLSLSGIQNILEIYSYLIDLARQFNLMKQISGNIVNLIEKTVITYFRKVQGNMTFESSNLYIQFQYIYNSNKDLTIPFTQNLKFILKFKKRQLQQTQFQFNKYYLVSFNLPSDVFITNPIENQFANNNNVIVALSPVTTNRLLYTDQNGMVHQEQNLFFSLDASLKGPQGKAIKFSPECYIFTNNLTYLDTISNLNFERINDFSQLQCENIGFNSTFIGLQLSQDYINSIDSSQENNKNNILQSISDDGDSFYSLKVGLIASFIIISHMMFFFTKFFCKGKTLIYTCILTKQSDETAIPNQSNVQSNTQKQEIQQKNQFNCTNIKEQMNQINIIKDKDQLNSNQNKIQNKYIKRKESLRIIAGIKMDTSQDFKQQQQQDQQQQYQIKQRDVPLIQEVCLQPQIISQIVEKPIQINNQNIQSLSNCSMSPDSIQIVFQNNFIHQNQNKETIKQSNTFSIVSNNAEQNQQSIQVNQNTSPKQDNIIKISNNQIFDKIFFYHSFTCFNISFEYCPNYFRVMHFALNYYMIASSNILVLSFLQRYNLEQIDQVIVSVIFGMAFTYLISFLVLLIFQAIFRFLKSENKLSNLQLFQYYLVFAILFAVGSVIISYSSSESSSYSVLSYIISIIISISLAIILESISLLFLKYHKSQRILQLIRYRSLDFQK